MVVVPVEQQDGSLKVRTAADLRADGYREFARWMQSAEDFWNALRKDKAARQSLYDRLDYQRELTIQNLRHRRLVLYNAPGTNISATYVDRESLSLPLLIEHMTCSP